MTNFLRKKVTSAFGNARRANQENETSDDIFNKPYVESDGSINDEIKRRGPRGHYKVGENFKKPSIPNAALLTQAAKDNGLFVEDSDDVYLALFEDGRVVEIKKNGKWWFYSMNGIQHRSTYLENIKKQMNDLGCTFFGLKKKG